MTPIDPDYMKSLGYRRAPGRNEWIPVRKDHAMSNDDNEAGYRQARGVAPAPEGTEPPEATIRRMRGHSDSAAPPPAATLTEAEAALERLAEVAARKYPAGLEHECADRRSVETAHNAILDQHGNRLADSLNSHVSELYADYDEDGSWYTDIGTYDLFKFWEQATPDRVLALLAVIRELRERDDRWQAMIGNLAHQAGQSQRVAARLRGALMQLLPLVEALQKLTGGQKEALSIEFARAALAADAPPTDADPLAAENERLTATLAELREREQAGRLDLAHVRKAGIEDMKRADAALADAARLRAQLAEAEAARAAVTAEHAATLDKYQSDIHKLRAAIIDHPDAPGGFIETVVAHIWAMRRGIAQLTVQHVITLTRAAEMTGLTIHQVRQWAKSGNMQRDADTALTEVRSE